MKETYEAARVEALLKAQLAGDTTAHRLVLEAFARIASLDRQGPCLGAVLEINPEAEAIARAMDAALAAGDVRGPLHGLPVLLKDNIDTADRLHTDRKSVV